MDHRELVRGRIASTCSRHCEIAARSLEPDIDEIFDVVRIQMARQDLARGQGDGRGLAVELRPEVGSERPRAHVMDAGLALALTGEREGDGAGHIEIVERRVWRQRTGNSSVGRSCTPEFSHLVSGVRPSGFLWQVALRCAPLAVPHRLDRLVRAEAELARGVRTRRDGASRTRTGDLLGAITPNGRPLRRLTLGQALPVELSSVEFAQFGSTVGSTLRFLGLRLPASPRKALSS
jgi:hypothetical protein